MFEKQSSKYQMSSNRNVKSTKFQTFLPEDAPFRSDPEIHIHISNSAAVVLLFALFGFVLFLLVAGAHVHLFALPSPHDLEAKAFGTNDQGTRSASASFQKKATSKAESDQIDVKFPASSAGPSASAGSLVMTEDNIILSNSRKKFEPRMNHPFNSSTGSQVVKRVINKSKFKADHDRTRPEQTHLNNDYNNHKNHHKDGNSQVQNTTKRKISHRTQGSIVEKRVPLLIGIGCQKCGTTSLWELLEKQGWAVPSLRKELRSFQRTSRLQYGIYRASWTAVSKGQIAYEISPRYLMDRRSPWRMVETIPHALTDLKFVVLLRNPMERAVSAYYQELFVMDRYSLRGGNSTLAPKLEQLVKAEMNFLKQCYNEDTLMKLDVLSCPLHLSAQNSNLKSEPASFPLLKTKHGGLGPFNSSYAMCLNRFVKESQVSKLAFNKIPASSFRRWMEVQVVEGGIYVDQLLNFLCAGFKPSQFLIVTSTQFRNDPDSFLHRLESFLTLPIAEQAAASFLKNSSAENLLLLEKKGSDQSRRSDSNPGRVRLSRGSSSRSQPNSLSKETLALLRDFYEPFNLRLKLLARYFDVSPEALDAEFDVLNP